MITEGLMSTELAMMHSLRSVAKGTNDPYPISRKVSVFRKQRKYVSKLPLFPDRLTAVLAAPFEANWYKLLGTLPALALSTGLQVSSLENEAGAHQTVQKFRKGD